MTTASTAGTATPLQAALTRQAASGGAGLRLLTEPVTSPTMARQLDEALRRFPAARWHQWDAVGRGDTVAAGARLAFGEAVEPRYLLERADVHGAR